jgi:hypothetical protein
MSVFMSFCARMCARFWPAVRQLPRGADYDFRTAPLGWADRYWTRALLLRVPLLGQPGPDTRQYRLVQWNEALALGNGELKRKVRLTPTVSSMEGIVAADLSRI